METRENETTNVTVVPVVEPRMTRSKTKSGPGEIVKQETGGDKPAESAVVVSSPTVSRKRKATTDDADETATVVLSQSSSTLEPLMDKRTNPAMPVVHGLSRKKAVFSIVFFVCFVKKFFYYKINKIQ